MGKKRKTPRDTEPKGPREVDPKDARLGPIRTYEDVADSEDEYFMNQEVIDFDDAPQSKRQKREEEEDDFLEPSDEEVLAHDDDDDDDEEDGIPAVQLKMAKKAKKKKGAVESDEEQGEKEEGEGDQGWWGSSKNEYYDADNIETEADALEEEQEAKRLQKQRLAKMAEEDFVFDGDEWLEEKDTEEDQAVVTEVLKEVEIPEDMSPDDRYKLLTSRYPEFEYLVGEFQTLQPQLPALQKEAEGQSSKSVAAIRYWVLGCYVAALASYFAILTSPSRDDSGVQKTMDPSELRDHEIMETLVSCRDAWTKIQNLKVLVAEPETQPMLPEPVDLAMAQDTAPITDGSEVKAPKKPKKKTKNVQEAEDVLADLENLPLTTKKSKKKAVPAQEDEEDSDFGEEESLDAKTAAEKARRKKSLRFYTSQIVQTANKRANAGRDAGGDADVPYRERLKDRQARLIAEAERRGRKTSKHGADLGDEDSNDEEDAAAVASALRNDQDDEYYDMVAASSAKKRADKADRYAAYAEARKGDLVVEQEEVGEDGKRKVTYAIEKNKGLMPKRKKENRNPRVKKRMRYESKLKKLASMKPVYKGQPAGGYKGETTGIKPGLVKSTKF